MNTENTFSFKKRNNENGGKKMKNKLTILSLNKINNFLTPFKYQVILILIIIKIFIMVIIL